MIAPIPPSPSEPWRRRLYLPAYSTSDVARYTGIDPHTVSRWYYGGAGLRPIFAEKPRKQPLSYLQLVEVAFVATFRQLGVSLQRLRSARDYLAQTFNAEYPFAEYRLTTEGRYVLLDLQQIEPDAEVGRLILADAHGQVAWRELVGDRFAQFDYEHGIAIRWHPAGRQSSVIIDPRISFGAPIVRGIPTWALKGRYAAGESIEELQEEFRLKEEEIRQALDFEGIRDAA